MTSARAVRVSMRATSWGNGTASWFAMISPATKASFQQGITEIGCMAHARRMFVDLHATNKSQLADWRCTKLAGCMKSNGKRGK